MKTKEQENPSPIDDEKPSTPQSVKAQEVRPQTLPGVKKKSGITMKGDYFDDKFGRA